MTKSEIHRMLRNPIYTGDFLWLGKRHRGSHEPLVTHETFEQVRAVLGGKPRVRSPRPRHAFNGPPDLRSVWLSIDGGDEERSVRVLPMHRLSWRLREQLHPRGRPGGSAPSSSESRSRQKSRIGSPRTFTSLSTRLSGLAEKASPGSRSAARQRNQGSIEATTTTSKDASQKHSGCESQPSGSRNSKRLRLNCVGSRVGYPTYLATGERILELAKTAHSRYLEQDFAERRRLSDPVLSNCTFDRGTLCPTYAKAVRPAGAGRRNWKLAERVGFEPTCRLPDKTLSRRPRYDHFGTSPDDGRPRLRADALRWGQG